MKYSDCPNVEVTTPIATTPMVVWALVSDIELSSRFSSEVSGAAWIDAHEGPGLDAHFVGHSAHAAIGEWTTTCVVTGYEVNRLFEWSVLGTENTVSSIWRYTIDDSGDGNVVLRYWFQMGPGPGGLNLAIEQMPDKEDRIIARRLGEHRANMELVVAGIKDLAESGDTAS